MSRLQSISRVIADGCRRCIGQPAVIASRSQFSIYVVVALVATRLMIGWHFFKEGTTKVHDRNFSSVGFLRGATGPFAGFYHSFLNDEDGRERLNYDPSAGGRDWINIEQTLFVWEIFREDIVKYYEFEPQQRSAAGSLERQFQRRLEAFFAENGDEINQYFQGLERRDANAGNPARRQVPTLKAQSEKITSELRGTSRPWLSQLDALWDLYEEQMNAIANQQQRQRRGDVPLELKKPGEVGSLVATVIHGEQPDATSVAVSSRFKMLDVAFVDRFIPTFDIIVGSLLILGLLTRVTSVVAAGFLCSVLASQWPWPATAMPLAVELTALLVLATTGAGRFAGLDFFIVNWQRCRAELNQVFSHQTQSSSTEAS